MRHDQFLVDGVLGYHFPSEEELTSVSLIFAAGTRDEPLTTPGSLHALEHLCHGRAIYRHAYRSRYRFHHTRSYRRAYYQHPYRYGFRAAYSGYGAYSSYKNFRYR